MSTPTDAQLDRAWAKVERIKKELRRLKALQRKRDAKAQLAADAALGKLVRTRHPELARLLSGS